MKTVQEISESMQPIVDDLINQHGEPDMKKMCSRCNMWLCWFNEGLVIEISREFENYETSVSTIVTPGGRFYLCEWKTYITPESHELIALAMSERINTYNIPWFIFSLYTEWYKEAILIQDINVCDTVEMVDIAKSYALFRQQSCMKLE